MTKKDYKKIAGVFHDAIYGEDITSKEMDKVIKLAGKFEDILREDNPRFDEKRFRVAIMGRN